MITQFNINIVICIDKGVHYYHWYYLLNINKKLMYAWKIE